MGRQKALIKWRGKSCLRHIVEAVRPCVRDAFVIRKDNLPACGPLGGIYTALCECHQDWAWFFPCDMPGLNTEILLWWKEQAESILGQTKISGPVHLIGSVSSQSSPGKKAYAGFPLLVHRSLRMKLKEQLQMGEYSLQKFVQLTRSSHVTLPAELEVYFNNINTPEDWRQFLEQNSRL